MRTPAKTARRWRRTGESDMIPTGWGPLGRPKALIDLNAPRRSGGPRGERSVLVSGSLRNVRGNKLVLAVAGAATVVTALVYGIPPLPFAYPLAGAAFFSAAATSIAGLAIAVFFTIRLQWTGRRTDGLL